jgi:glycosyltransferase involved in cell wall biosynthesis
MRILITSLFDLRKTAPHRLHHFIKHLVQRHHITVLSINDFWKAGQVDVRLYSQDFEDILRKIDIKYFMTQRISPILQEVFSFLRLRQLLKELEPQGFDVHLNVGTLISGCYISRRMKALGVNTVYDMSDDYVEFIRNSPQIIPPLRPLGGFLGSLMIRESFNIATKITFTNNTLRQAYHLHQNKSELIPNGVDIDLFRSYDTRQLEEQLGIEQDFVIGYVGALREWVDLEPSFIAVKQLIKEHPEMKILIVGEEGRFQENKDLAKRHEIQDRVIFTGTIPYGQVPKYISCMDICLIPFKNNAVGHGASPLKLLEYMACERPVISTRLTGVTEAVGKRVLYASSVEELRQRILELHTNEKKHKELVTEGRKFVEKNYSWQHFCSRFEEVLMETASLGGRE